MNNIGGIIKCEICPIDKVTTFSHTETKVSVSSADNGSLWIDLPINRKNTSCAATPASNDAGTVYQHSCNTLLPMPFVTTNLLATVRKCAKCGCLIRYTDANKQLRILGTNEYPLIGTLEESPGNNASDLAGFQLRLSATSLTPALVYIEV